MDRSCSESAAPTSASRAASVDPAWRQKAHRESGTRADTRLRGEYRSRLSSHPPRGVRGVAQSSFILPNRSEQRSKRAARAPGCCLSLNRIDLNVTVMAARRPPLEIAQQHEKKGNLAKAAEAYSEYLSSKPNDARVLLRLAEIRERLGQAALAADAFHQLGVLHAKDGMESKATAMLRRALKLMPSHLTSVQLMAEVLARAGKTRDALDTLAAGSQTAAAAGDSRTRLKMLERAANLDPGLS